MTRVRMALKDGRLAVEVRGHAGYAEAGKDVACAGVSALVCALAGYLQNCAEAEELRLEPGNVRIRGRGAVDQAAAMAYIGFLELQEAFPKNIFVEGSFPDDFPRRT